MVIHDGVRIKDPLVQFDGVKKSADKKTFRSVLPKDEGTTFGSIIGMVDALIRKLAETAGHGAYLKHGESTHEFRDAPRVVAQNTPQKGSGR